jgi:hypothetical protein
VASLACGPGFGACAVLVAGATSAAITGITGGNLSQSLRAGLIAATSALAFNAVGDLTLGPGHPTASFGSSQHLSNIAGHAAVGCVMAVASGGKCGQGAASGAIGAAGSPVIATYLPDFKTDPAQFVAGAAISAGLGGLASVASGGKFVTGAETAAFGYLFNATQVSVGLSNTIAVMFGVGSSVSVGLSIPDSWSSLSEYQVFGTGQVQVMRGNGAYIGINGFGGGYGSSNGPLSPLSTDSGRYWEGDAGYNASIGSSRQGSYGDPPNGGSMTLVPRIGTGYGVYAGEGVYKSLTIATPTWSQIRNWWNSK